MSKTYRLAIVDDNHSEHKLLSLLVRIKKLPFEVICHSDPKLALDYLEKASDDSFPHVIVADIKMPYMDGFELADEFAQKFRARFPQTLFIISSSTIRLDDIERAENHPAVNCFIEKPFNEEKLRKDILNKLNILS